MQTLITHKNNLTLLLIKFDKNSPRNVNPHTPKCLNFLMKIVFLQK